jgi:hypothetical protein
MQLCKKAYPNYTLHEGNNLKKLKYEDTLSVLESINTGHILMGHFSLTEPELLLRLSKELKCITPMRDPLLALISWYYRHKIKANDNTDVRYLFVGFLLWAEKFFNNTLNVTVDIDNDVKHEKIDFSNIDVHGSAGQYKLKKAYYDKDIKYIKLNLGEIYYMLSQSEFYLRPKLEQLGYENLLWWGEAQTQDKESLVNLYKVSEKYKKQLLN